MNKWLNTALKAMLASAIVLVGVGEASAQSVLSIHDHASGEIRTFSSNDSVFTISGNGETVDLSASKFAKQLGGHWYLKFEAPQGQTLAPGRYENAGCTSAFRTGRAPGMQITDNNPICMLAAGGDTVWGWFVIRQIAYDSAGAVVSIEAIFSQRHGAPDAPPLTGVIRYQAPGRSFKVQSEPGFAWGEIAQKNHGDSSLFWLEGTLDGLDYRASVRKDTWKIFIDPPTGQQLQLGHYQTSNLADASHAGLYIQRGFAPQYCSNGVGSLDIDKIDADSAGSIRSLIASFEYRCGAGTPALRGSIRYAAPPAIQAPASRNRPQGG